MYTQVKKKRIFSPTTVGIYSNHLQWRKVCHSSHKKKYGARNNQSFNTQNYSSHQTVYGARNNPLIPKTTQDGTFTERRSLNYYSEHGSRWVKKPANQRHHYLTKQKDHINNWQCIQGMTRAPKNQTVERVRQ